MARDSRTAFDPLRLEFLEKASQALRGATDPESALQLATRSAIPELADIVIILSGNGAAERLQVAHLDPGQEQKVLEVLQPLLPAVRSAAVRDGSRSRQFRWIPRVTEMSLRFLSEEPELAEVVYLLNIRSFIAVPLRSGGRVLGGIAFCRTRDEPFHAADLAIAQVLARRSAAAIENAQLHERAVDEQARRARLEAALQKWVRVFDLAGWGAAIVDGSDYRIEAVNPAFAQLHGYGDIGALIGRLYTDLVPPTGSHEPEEWIRAVATQAGPYESFHVRADGTVFPVLTDVTVLDTAEGATSFVVTIQDVTELKRTEERLQRAQRLEAVGRLAGGVAHEVNNMMTIILGFSDLLARGERLPPEHQRELEEIRKAATRAGKITQQLLAFSRQQVLQPTELDLNGVVSELVPVLRLLLPANIRLETSFAPVGATVRADRAQLDQVLINLAFNSRDAMPGGGMVRLTTGSRRLEENDGRRLIGIPIPPGQYALISVVDTGHGMDPATLMQVFEPFFTTKPTGSGTGLGLATVYGIVKQSGGYVWVESTPGTGTTVTVCLPEVDAAIPPPESFAGGARSAECRTGTILVVEDEEGVRQLALRVLMEQGHRVLEASDGDTAVRILRQFGAELDLVLTDVIVPGIATPELEREVRHHRSDLPILYMSGYSREEMVSRGLIDPKRPFLQKPFTAPELTGMICQELERRPPAVVAG